MMRQIEPEQVAALRLERGSGVGFVALADPGGRRRARSSSVRAPVPAATPGVDEDGETAHLCVDVDEEGRLLGIEVPSPPAQLPWAVLFRPPDDTALEACWLASGAMRVVVDADAEVVARVPIRGVAGGEAPTVLFDREGRLVAIDVPEPSVQLRPELLRRVGHEQAAPEAVFGALDTVLWVAGGFEEALAQALDAERWSATALVVRAVPSPERLLQVRTGGLPGGAIGDDAIVALLERELRADPWSLLVAVDPLGKPGDGYLARADAPHEAVGTTVVYPVAARDRPSIAAAWRAAAGGPGPVALLTRRAPAAAAGAPAALVATATLVVLLAYDGEGLLVLRRREPSPLEPLDALWVLHRVELGTTTSASRS